MPANVYFSLFFLIQVNGLLMGRDRVAVCGWQLPQFEPNVQLEVSPIIEQHKSTRFFRVPQ